MFSTPVRMSHVVLRMLIEDSQEAANTLADMQAIHLTRETDEKNLPDYPALEYHNVYQRLYSRYRKLLAFHDPIQTDIKKTDAVTLKQLQQADNEMKQLWQQVSAIEEKLRQLRESRNSIRQMSNSLEKFHSLDLDLGKVNQQSRFLNIIIGTVPASHFKRLEESLSLAGYLIDIYNSAEDLFYVMVTGSRENDRDVMSLLKTADFREISIPEQFTDHPEKIRHDIDKKLQLNQEQEQAIRDQLASVLQQHQEQIQQTRQVLASASPFARLAPSLQGKGALVTLSGWIPASREQELEQQLQNRLNHPFQLVLRTPEFKELEQVPSLLKPTKLFLPFQQLVNNFGIPRYGEIDPTRLFSFSYILMFGMMFGDIGHGAVIILLGLWLGDKLPGLRNFTLLTGLSSITFGFIYGSLFGYEHIIHPVWMSPMQDPTLVLLLALVWGIGFLLIASLLSIRNLFALGQHRAAWFSSKGVAGLLFYTGGIYVGWSVMANESFSAWELTAPAIPLSVVLFFQWQHIEGSLFERILVTAIEGLEQVISNLSATLSFLRVAAFSLNHVALATAVFTLAAMMDTTGHWITVVLGNLFIIVLEGAIVAIQCLRLEYYEGFSRFFSGKGKKFEPLKAETV